MKRLKLEPKDIELLGFKKEYEISGQFLFNKGDEFIIRINENQFEMHRFDSTCPFVFRCPMKNMSTEILRNILKWNEDVLSIVPLTADELGDDLCKYCPLEKKGVYSVNGGSVAGCEGSKCHIAYEYYLEAMGDD